MKLGKLSVVVSRTFLLLCCMLFALPSQAADELNSATLDKWLTTTKEFIPMQDVFDRISEESEIAKKYTQDEFKAMDVAEQDKLMDQLLKDEAVYDEVYSVLNAQDWSSAGQYIRVSTRIATGVQVYMQDMMLKNLPAEQAQMVKEMMGGEVQADPQDVEFVSNNWTKISTFLGDNIDTSAISSMGK
ncbi:hypothetical protein [Gilvimarinus polysaccharolyticus]|uniref:hypothetical protein n=1 Tax=Gilvimarinus polysaccharolyticus TaxID=863921 RepID=UPI000673A283|nr:hypothetical protein [Gilvimarinus polysaccharolyticus]